MYVNKEVYRIGRDAQDDPGQIEPIPTEVIKKVYLKDIMILVAQAK